MSQPCKIKRPSKFPLADNSDFWGFAPACPAVKCPVIGVVLAGVVFFRLSHGHTGRDVPQEAGDWTVRLYEASVL